MVIFFGSSRNFVSGYGNTVPSMVDQNAIVASHGVYANGASNFIANSYGGQTIAGSYNVFAAQSSYNDIYGTGNVILGGANCYHSFTTNYQNGHVMLGGYLNRLYGTNTAFGSSVIGGSNNKVRDYGNSILGGDNNLINEADAERNAIIGGQYGEVKGGAIDSGILGGNNNQVYGNSVNCGVIGGTYNVVRATGSVALGGQHNVVGASAPHGVLMGQYSRITRAGEFAHNSVAFNDNTGGTVNNDRGYHRLTGNVKTTDDSATTVLSITLSEGLAMHVEIWVVGNQDGGDERKSFVRQVLCHRDGSGSLVLDDVRQPVTEDVGSSSSLDEDSDAWDVQINADGNAIDVDVVGEAATDVNWIAVAQWAGIGEVVN